MDKTTKSYYSRLSRDLGKENEIGENMSLGSPSNKLFMKGIREAGSRFGVRVDIVSACVFCEDRDTRYVCISTGND